ncbi:MAG: precorrin-8X methylmutase [Cyanobacteria bacterium P01_D01_bin.1]
MNLHPITAESFAIIDREIGPHSRPLQEYAVIRRAIHATADFELLDLFEFSPGAIDSGIAALQHRDSVAVDVRMVQMGIASTLKALGYDQIPCALDFASDSSPAPEAQASVPATTRTAAGMLALTQHYPTGIFVIGNAPTALLALAEQIRLGQVQPALVVGVPVGFVAVEEAKQALAAVAVPQIQVRGRKGGSAVAAAIVNALAYLSRA